MISYFRTDWLNIESLPRGLKDKKQGKKGGTTFILSTSKCMYYGSITVAMLMHGDFYTRKISACSMKVH